MQLAGRRVGFLIALSITGGFAVAQETRASLSGLVTDMSGSVVPGTTLKLTNIDTGVVSSTRANEAGLYRFLFLDPGKYRLDATSSGFKTWERDNIELSVNKAATLPVVLEVGSQTEKITVSAEAPLIEAEKADRGLLIDNKKVVDLPINTRNPIMLDGAPNSTIYNQVTTVAIVPSVDSVQADPNLTPTSTNFGKVIRDNGQSNAPRTVQFGF